MEEVERINREIEDLKEAHNLEVRRREDDVVASVIALGVSLCVLNCIDIALTEEDFKC